MFERDGNLNNVNLGMENQNIFFIPVNVTSVYWQVMVIVRAADESKVTEILFFAFQLKIIDTRKNYHIDCITGHATEELKVHFWKYV